MPGQVGEDLREALGLEDADIRGAPGERCVGRRDDDFANAHITQREHRGEAAAGRTQAAIECELTEKPTAYQRLVVESFSHGREDCDRNREVEPSALFSEFRGCEIHGHAPIGKGKASCRNRSADAGSTFAYRCFGQANHVDSREL